MIVVPRRPFLAPGDPVLSRAMSSWPSTSVSSLRNTHLCRYGLPRDVNRASAIYSCLSLSYKYLIARQRLAGRVGCNISIGWFGETKLSRSTSKDGIRWMCPIFILQLRKTLHKRYPYSLCSILTDYVHDSSTLLPAFCNIADPCHLAPFNQTRYMTSLVKGFGPLPSVNFPCFDKSVSVSF